VQTVPVPSHGGIPVHGEHGRRVRRVELQAMQQAGVRNQFNLLNDEGLDEGDAELAAALLRGEEVPHRQEAGIVLEQPEEREAATEEEEQEQENAGAGMRLWVCIGGGVVVLLAAGLVHLGAGLVRVYSFSAGLLLATTAAVIARAAPEQERLGLAAWGYRASRTFLVLLAATATVRATLPHVFVRPAPIHPFGAAYRDIVADAGMVAWIRGAAHLVALLVASVAAASGPRRFPTRRPGRPPAHCLTPCGGPVSRHCGSADCYGYPKMLDSLLWPFLSPFILSEPLMLN
jgi:cation transport ATPase